MTASDAGVRRLASAWFGLALGALGLSALFAVVLVAARTPFLGQGAGVFRTALVLHVNLSVQIWFLAMAAGISTLAAARAGRLGWSAWWLALAGMATLLASALTGAAPVLTNYVPLLDTPLFFGGMGAFALAIGLMAANALPALPAMWRGEAWRQASAWALPALAIVLAMTAAGLLPGGASLDQQLWGIGHALQFVHVILLMAAWAMLGGDLLDRMPAFKRALPGIYALAMLPVVGGAGVALLHDAASVEYHDAFTWLMRWGSWPAAAILGLALAKQLVVLAQRERLSAEHQGLALSLLLFLIGCLVGAAINGDSLSVPAHYHGTVGSVTLAYLVWWRKLAPTLDVDARRLPALDRLPLVYGGGIVILVAGLAAAGQLGIPRKAAHSDLGLDAASYYAAMGTAGLGGFIALAAIAVFTALALRALLTREAAPQRRDMRPLALALVLLLIVGGGVLLERWNTDPAADNLRRHVVEKRQAEIARRFEQGVIMLHAKQYDHALTAFHRVLQLAPEMPEAHVNLGFALVGLKRYKEAADFFDGATELRHDQINAYYGLALALEGMGDLRGAVEAMNAYLHRAKADDRYRRKAESAVWEWRETLAQRAEAPKP